MRWFRRMFVWFKSAFRRTPRPPAPKPPRSSGRRIGLEGLENRQLPSTFTVVNTNDSGGGSLRDAMNNVADAGSGTIDFNIGNGPQIIKLQSALPSLFQASFTIDGSTQPGYAGTPLIDIDGAQAGSATDGLDLVVGSLTVTGLDFTNFSGAGLVVEGASSGLIADNYLGVNLAGDTAAGNGNAGLVLVNGASNVTVSNNVISGNGFNGLHSGIDIDTAADDNIIQDNRIGTNAAGNAPIPNADHGIALFDNASENTIGGFGSGAANVISGNDQFGVEMFSSAEDNVVEGNLIGTDSTGMQPLGNQLGGVRIHQGSSDNSITSNVIAYNPVGVVIADSDSVGNSILGNSIFGNTGLGIDLGDDGVTPNQPGGSGNGPNDLQSYPVLTSASDVGGTGYLTGTPGIEYEVQIFASPANGPARQGQEFLDSLIAIPDATGQANFSFFLEGGVDNAVVTATATNLTTGDTSEFSAGPPTSFTIAGPTSQSATVGTAFASPLLTVVADAYNEPVQGITVGLSAPEIGPGGTFPGGATVAADSTDANGAVAPVFTANTVPGTYSVTEDVNGFAPLTFTLTNTPGAAASLVLQGVPPTVAGVAQAFTVTAFDQYGNVATGYRGTLDFTSSDPQAVLPAPYTFTAADNGQHTFHVTLKTAGPQSLSMTDGNLTVAQSGIVVSPAAMTGFAVTAPLAIAQGSPFGLTVRAVDAFGNTVPSYSGTVQFSSDDTFAVLAPAQPFAGGVQTFANVGSLATPGVQIIAVTDVAQPSLTGSSTVTVTNVAPSGLTLTPSMTALKIGDGLTLNGSFTDPGRGDAHSVAIDWGDGTADTTLSLGAGVLTFQATHVYVQGLPAGAGIGTVSIDASVSDATATTAATTAITLTDVPPVVALSTNVTVLNVGAALSATGAFVSPGLFAFTATVDFGDGTGLQQLPFTAAHTFDLNHVYDREGSFNVTVSVNDGHDNFGVASLLANVVLVGIDVPGVAVVGTNGGTTATASAPGVSATLTTGAPSNAFIIVSVVPPAVARQIIPATQQAANTVIDSSYDIRAVNVNDSDSATVTFTYSADDPNPVLDYVDPDGMLKQVKGSTDPTKGLTYFVNAANHTITVVFDASSTPSITALQGTVFAVSVGAPAPAVAFPTTNPTGNPNGTLVALAIEPTNPGVVADVGPTFTVSAEPTAVTAPSASTAEGSSAAAGGGDDSTPPAQQQRLPKDDPLADLPPPPAALPPAPPPVILAPSQLDLGVPPDPKPAPPPPPEEAQQSAAPAFGPDVVLYATDYQPTAAPIVAKSVHSDEPTNPSRPARGLSCVGGVVLVWYHQGNRSSPAASRRPPRHAPPARRQRARK